MKGHPYSQPFKWGEDVGVSNGWVALRIHTFIDCDRECPEAVTRIEKQRWSFFDMNLPDTNWGRLDDRRAGLWKFGPMSMWGKTGSGKVYAKTLRRIRVGNVTVVSQPILQFISKLPRAEVYTAGGYGEPLFFRFNGGEGIAAGLHDSRQEDNLVRFGIFQKSREFFDEL